MAIVYKGTVITELIYKGTVIDEAYRNSTLVYESTVYVARPTVTGAFTFDNSAKTPTITGYDATAMTISGTQSATAAGTYTITFTPKSGYAWDDKSTTPYGATWTIAKRVITIPSITSGTFTWSPSTTFGATVSNLNTAYVTQTGTATSTSSGSYTLTWALKYPASTTWTDGTTANKTGTWMVKKRALSIPTISGSSTFNKVDASSFAPSISGFNSTYETQGGTASASAIATYTITWALRYPSDTTWSDGTTANKSATWKIVAGTMTWYLLTGGLTYTFRTTYGVTFYDAAGVVSTTVSGQYAKIIQDATYAEYDMYDSEGRLFTNAFRDGGGNQYLNTDVPVNGQTYR